MQPPDNSRQRYGEVWTGPAGNGGGVEERYDLGVERGVVRGGSTEIRKVAGAAAGSVWTLCQGMLAAQLDLLHGLEIYASSKPRGNMKRNTIHILFGSLIQS